VRLARRPHYLCCFSQIPLRNERGMTWVKSPQLQRQHRAR
jgi:hypothetical protein